MDVVREALSGRPRLRCNRRFNPCSNGCRSGSGVLEIRAEAPTAVSILVLMDVVREDVFFKSGN